MPILETRSEVKVAVALGRYATLIHPEMRAHTKFGIPTYNNISDMLQKQHKSKKVMFIFSLHIHILSERVYAIVV